MYLYLKDIVVRRVVSGVYLLKLSSVLSFEANPLALALVSHYVFIYHFTGLEVHFPGYRTPPSLRQRLGLPPLCAFSLWFYDRSARLNSFFTYVKYITLHYLLYGYKRHIIKVSTNISDLHLCAFSLWFYDRSARLNSFFTYVKYITLHYLLYGYKRHIIKVSTNI